MSSFSDPTVVSAENGSEMSTRSRSQRLLQSSQTEPVENLNILPSGNEPSLSTQPNPLVHLIRSASRLLVRELGFMSPTLAGTSLSPSSVHALLEISSPPPSSTNHASKTTATSLSHTLNLEKSSISRMVKRLVELDLVREEVSGDDKREKFITLTEKGWEMVRGINEFADKQVGNALEKLEGGNGEGETVLRGIEKYANALKDSRLGTVPNVEKRLEGLGGDVEIRKGYRPGILGRCLEMHMEYYSSTVALGAFFEAELATGLGELLSRIRTSGEGDVWAAVAGGRIVGTVWMGDSMSKSKKDGGECDVRRAHLRAFIVDGCVRGRGVGRRLITEALGWADVTGYEEVELWTFKGLDAARKLYDGCGFVLREEMVSAMWGAELMVQHFVRERKS